MSKLYIDNTNKKLYIFSYAGGTKFFMKMLNEKLHWIVPYNGNNLSPENKDYEIIQVVRKPVQRYKSWFDKQYAKRLVKTQGIVDVESWIKEVFTKEWFEEFFSYQQYEIHYDGHTCFQSLWPRHFLKFISDKPWLYLRMEDINTHFFGTEPFAPRRDPKEYVGVWDILDQDVIDYVDQELVKIYNADIVWYNSLKFI